MTTADLNSFLLRSLRRKSPMTEDELGIAAKNVFQAECKSSDVRERLGDLDDKGYVTCEQSDGITPATYALTAKGQHKAKTL